MNASTDCQLCGKTYRHLGAHIVQAHGMKARDYKLQFGLDVGLGLIAEDVAGKLSAAAKAHDMGEQLIRVGAQTRFSAGQGQPKYVSKESRRRLIHQLRKFEAKHPEFNGRREYERRRKEALALITG